MSGRVERVADEEGLVFNVYQGGEEEDAGTRASAVPLMVPRLASSPTANVSGQVGGIDWDMLEARGDAPIQAQIRTVSEDVIRRGDDDEAQSYLRQPVYVRPLGGGLQPAFVPAPRRAAPRPAAPADEVPSMFAPQPPPPATESAGGGGGGGGPPQPRGTAQLGGRGLAPLVDPAQSVLTFAALLSDSLDTNGEDLLDPATGMFTTRIMGMLVKARREIVDAVGDETIKLEMLIYDNPDNDAVRIKFADLVEYRTRMKGQGYAFANNVYARQAACDRQGGSFTRGYRLSENYHRRRFNIEAYRHKLAWFDTVYSVENPLIQRYKKLRVEALNNLARLNRNRQLRRGPARPTVAAFEPEPERGGGGGGGGITLSPAEETPPPAQPLDLNLSDEELEVAEADILNDVVSEDDAGDSQGESFPASVLSEAAMHIGFPRTGQRTRQRELDRYEALVLRAREGYYAIKRYMPRVLVPGFQE